MSDTDARPSTAGDAVELDRVIIRFAGDSGDGMQLTGDRFTSVSTLIGNDVVTLPEFPAEIRAPAGTLAGVSAFQIHVSDHDITTPGDAPQVLVAQGQQIGAGGGLEHFPGAAQIRPHRHGIGEGLPVGALQAADARAIHPHAHPEDLMDLAGGIIAGLLIPAAAAAGAMLGDLFG